MIPKEPPHPIVAQVPVLATVGEAYRESCRHWRALVTVAIVPIALDLALRFACFFVIGGPYDGPVYYLLALLPESLLVVAWCRHLLLSQANQTPRPLVPLNRRHLRALGILLVLAVTWYPFDAGYSYATRVLGIELTLLQSWLLFAVILSFHYFFLRLALTLPAASADEFFRFRDAWRASRGQGIRLFLAAILAVLPILILSITLDSYFESWTGYEFYWPDSPADPTFGWPLVAVTSANDVLNYIGFALELVILTSVFRRVTGWLPPPDPSLLQRFD